MGTGKTTVGRRIAEILKIPFFDVDETIKRNTGSSVAELFRDRGEAAFRELENATIRELVQREQRAVISTGGGALLNPENKKLLEDRGILVCLTAKTGSLLERLKDDVTRPLLAGENVEQKIERLLQERKAVYELCPIQIMTDGKTIPQVAEDVIQAIAPRWQTS